jgi:hypothetical protein
MKDVDRELILSWLPLMDYILPNEEEALYVVDAAFVLLLCLVYVFLLGGLSLMC